LWLLASSLDPEPEPDPDGPTLVAVAVAGTVADASGVRVPTKDGVGGPWPVLVVGRLLGVEEMGRGPGLAVVWDGTAMAGLAMVVEVVVEDVEVVVLAVHPLGRRL